MNCFDLKRNWKGRIRFGFTGRENCCDTFHFIRTHFPKTRPGCLTCVYVYDCDIIYVYINKVTGCQEGPSHGYEFFTSVDNFKEAR